MDVALASNQPCGSMADHEDTRGVDAFQIFTLDEDEEIVLLAS